MTNIGDILMQDMIKNFEEDYGDNNVIQSAKSIFEQLELLQDYWEDLRNQQSKIDLAIQDIEHFIEISDNLNAAEGYNTYKMLRDLLRKRRDNKNTMSELKVLIDNLQPRNLVKSKDKVITEIKKKATFNNGDKFYRTRVLKDIFGDKIK